MLDAHPDRAMVAEPTGFGTAAPYFGNGQDMFHMAFDFDYGFLWDAFFGGASARPLADHFSTVPQTYPPGAQAALSSAPTTSPAPSSGRRGSRRAGAGRRWSR